MSLLHWYLEQSGYKIKYIAMRLNITYVSLHHKLVGNRTFTTKEAYLLKELLHISEEDFKDIFDGHVRD